MLSLSGFIKNIDFDDNFCISILFGASVIRRRRFSANQSSDTLVFFPYKYGSSCKAVIASVFGTLIIKITASPKIVFSINNVDARASHYQYKMW